MRQSNIPMKKQITINESSLIPRSPATPKKFITTNDREFYQNERKTNITIKEYPDLVNIWKYANLTMSGTYYFGTHIQVIQDEIPTLPDQRLQSSTNGSNITISLPRVVRVSNLFCIFGGVVPDGSPSTLTTTIAISTDGSTFTTIGTVVISIAAGGSATFGSFSGGSRELKAIRITPTGSYPGTYPVWVHCYSIQE